ncbi:SPOR domain-containing protein [Flavobacterium rhizosphaerae]|uniref:SPOR domain-containing protein n=1 Tax=Flavobacterium rhizosphaerae TaxID=3163298 RepID=A0ABW8YV76_9FLAO
MRILKPETAFLALLFCILFNYTTVAQQGGISVEQDNRFEELLNEKRKINPNIIVNDKYKIQIFYGENAKARKTLTQFKKDYKDLDGTIVYESPTYKVWVGSFSSRIEAEKKLTEVKEKYPYALLIKPNK